MERRRFLTAVGAGIVGIAGCSSTETNEISQKTTSTTTATESTTESTTTAETTETSESTSTTTKESTYAVRVVYSGDWSGTIGTLEGSRTVDGSGTTTITVTGDPSMVSANAQKKDDSSQKLTLQILKNGDVIAEKSTTAAYGIVQVTSQGGADGESGSGGDTAASFTVKVIYSGQWQGSVGTSGSTRSISGTGTKTIDVEGSPNIITVNAQKKDDSSQKLTVQILKNGDVVAEQSTTAAYGLAQVSETFY